MTRLRIRQFAEKKGFTISRLYAEVNQRRSVDNQISLPTIRRYWYSTKEGREQGEELSIVDLTIVSEIADVIGVDPRELVEYPVASRGNSKPALIPA